MNGDERFKVYNRCHFDIGVRLLNGMMISIPSGSFQMMSGNDILFVDSICKRKRFFSTGMLEAVDDAGKPVPFDRIGVVECAPEDKHLTDDDIKGYLRQSPKKLEAWISGITDAVELHNIAEVAKKMDDLPANKLRILTDALPDVDFFEE